MDGKILVTYASKYGATREIAEKIGEVILQAGLPVDIIPVNRIRDLTPYSAVVLGSAIYIGKWQKEAVAFLQAHEQILSGLPVWLFSSGPTGAGDPLKLVQGQILPDLLKPLVGRIHPRDVVVFGGNINLKRVNFIEKWAIQKMVKAPTGDFRDWLSITSWATTIAEALKASAPQAALA